MDSWRKGKIGQGWLFTEMVLGVAGGVFGMAMSERRVGTGSLASTRVYIPWNLEIAPSHSNCRFTQACVVEEVEDHDAMVSSPRHVSYPHSEHHSFHVVTSDISLFFTLLSSTFISMFNLAIHEDRRLLLSSPLFFVFIWHFYSYLLLLILSFIFLFYFLPFGVPLQNVFFMSV